MGMMTFNLPDPGEGLVEAEIVGWRVAVGDAVKVNDIVVEIETAKSLVELPIPWDGTVSQILVEVGQVVEVGAPIIVVDVPGVDGSPAPEAPQAQPAVAEAEPVERVANLVGYGAVAGATSRRRRKSAPAAPAAPPPASVTPSAPPPAAAPVAGSARPLAKPPVRKYAKDRGVDLAQVAGTGADGVVTRTDIDTFLAGASVVPAGAGAAVGAQPVGVTSGQREVRVPIKGVRKMTAQAMVASAFSAPTVSEFVTVDITPTMDLIARLRGEREYRDVRLTELVFVAKALLLAVRRNPGVNATWDEAAQEIVLKNYVNLGIAAATPRGLIVPNIKDAHLMPVKELAQALTALVATARDGRTPPADMAGGTITITNIGVFGIDTGTPILNPGESMILCFGAIKRKPWVVTGPDGAESIQPRWVTELAISFDHRLVDGDLGSRFLADVAAVLADPAQGLLWA